MDNGNSFVISWGEGVMQLLHPQLNLKSSVHNLQVYEISTESSDSDSIEVEPERYVPSFLTQ